MPNQLLVVLASESCRAARTGGEEWREQHQVIQLNHISSFETRLKSKALVLLLVRSLLHLAQFGNRILK